VASFSHLLGEGDLRQRAKGILGLTRAGEPRPQFVGHRAPQVLAARHFDPGLPSQLRERHAEGRQRRLERGGAGVGLEGQSRGDLRGTRGHRVGGQRERRRRLKERRIDADRARCDLARLCQYSARIVHLLRGVAQFGKARCLPRPPLGVESARPLAHGAGGIAMGLVKAQRRVEKGREFGRTRGERARVRPQRLGANADHLGKLGGFGVGHLGQGHDAAEGREFLRDDIGGAAAFKDRIEGSEIGGLRLEHRRRLRPARVGMSRGLRGQILLRFLDLLLHLLALEPRCPQARRAVGQRLEAEDPGERIEKLRRLLLEDAPEFVVREHGPVRHRRRGPAEGIPRGASLARKLNRLGAIDDTRLVGPVDPRLAGTAALDREARADRRTRIMEVAEALFPLRVALVPARVARVISSSAASAKLDLPQPLRPTTRVRPGPGASVSAVSGPMPRNPRTRISCRKTLAGSGGGGGVSPRVIPATGA
jgi:hypothetical protein